MRRAVGLLSAILLALALIAFAVANRTPVLVTLPLSEIALRLPLHLVFFAGLLLGACLAGLVMLWPRLRSGLRGRRLRKRAEAAEARVRALESERPAPAAERLAAIDRAQDAGLDESRPAVTSARRSA